MLVESPVLIESRIQIIIIISVVVQGKFILKSNPNVTTQKSSVIFLIHFMR